jgi:hypothetical protein
MAIRNWNLSVILFPYTESSLTPSVTATCQLGKMTSIRVHDISYLLFEGVEVMWKRTFVGFIIFVNKDLDVDNLQCKIYTPFWI